MTNENISSQKHVKYMGPHGLGDPDDLSLRKVEVDVLIAKKLRIKARAEKCVKEVEDFNKCCMENGISLVVTCQDVNKKMKSCLQYWWENDEFKKLCREEYLKERADYRRTGLSLKQREELGN